MTLVLLQIIAAFHGAKHRVYSLKTTKIVSQRDPKGMGKNLLRYLSGLTEHFLPRGILHLKAKKPTAFAHQVSAGPKSNRNVSMELHHSLEKYP